MAVDKLVDSAQLDADLTSVANAIRTKGGTSASLAFPSGFVSAINAISGGGEPSEVPTGYTQLDYIETSGGAYIDTGIAWGANKKIELSWAHDGSVARAQYAHPFGSNVCFVQLATTTYCPNANVKINDATYTKNVIVPCTPHTMVVTPTLLSAKGYKAYSPAGTLLSKSGSVTTTGQTLAIGMRHNTSSYDYPLAGMIIYRWKLYDNNQLIQDLVPAKRNSDNVLGLYDVVNNTFLVNAGSGSFTSTS